MMGKYVDETAAAKSVRAIVIMKGARHVATVKAHFSNGGRCLVNIWQQRGTPIFQSGSAYGYGYDKFTAALRGLIIDGHELTDHCGRNRKPPRGRRLWAADAKPPRGWRVANWTTIDRVTGELLGSYHWRDLAIDELPEGSDGQTIRRRAAELKAAADIEEGYADCFRDSGLDYLKAIGYTVITAI